MIKYLGSKIFIYTVLLFALLWGFVGLNDLSTYVQDSQIFFWSFYLWHEHKKHKLLDDFIDGD